MEYFNDLDPVLLLGILHWRHLSSCEAAFLKVFGAASNPRWSPVVRKMFTIEPTVVMVIEDPIGFNLQRPVVIGTFGHPHVATGCFQQAV